MPEVCRFFGIVVRMYSTNTIHPISTPSHAIYGEREAQFGIDPIIVLEGNLSNRATSLVIEWAALHQRELPLVSVAKLARHVAQVF